MVDYSSGMAEKTVGLDMGDRSNWVVVLDREGEVIESCSIANTAAGLQRFFSKLCPSRVALEAGTHAGWASRLLSSLGHEVYVANSRQLRLIYQNAHKDDRVDAEYLARLARVDPKLLSPVQVRGEQVQGDWALLKGRAALVACRSKLINQCRGAVKQLGRRLPGCSTASFARRAWPEVPEQLKEALEPLVEMIGQLSAQIGRLGREIEAKCERVYPQTGVLRQIGGVGPITALAFVLRLESAERFQKSRDVGPYLGLTPRRRQSGGRDPQLRISKQGDRTLRCLLVNCAHYILGPFGADCDLRRKGLQLAARGGKLAKKKAVVAVARKLAVLMHRLWATGDVYEPLYNASAQAA